MNQTKWFDRKFQFDFPVGVFPTILERLRGTPARIADLVQTFPSEVMIMRVDGAWSIQEHVGHLLDLGELDAKRLDDYLTGAKELSKADLQNRKTEEANHHSKSIETLLREFRTERHQLVARLEQLSEEQVSRSAIHPRLQQPMRVVDWCYFVAEHDDHHVAKMTHLARTLAATPKK